MNNTLGNNVIDILYLTHTDINSDSRILKEMEAARAAGFKVAGIGVYSSYEEAAENKSGLKIDTLSLYSKRMRLLPKPLRHALNLLELFPKMVKRSNKLKPLVVHCNDTLVLPIGYFVAKINKAKLVYDAHELESNKNGQGKIAGAVTLLIEKSLWKAVDRLIVVGQAIETWYHENLGYKESIVVLNSPIVSNSQYDISSDYLRQKFSISLDHKIFLYIGILARGRGLELAIDAFIACTEKADLVLLGFGEYGKELRARAKDCDRIHFHEAVPHDQVVGIAKTADYGLCLIENVSLSDYYCLPNKLFEYCFAGIPVIASDFPEIARVVTAYKLGYCCELSIAGIKLAILRALSNDKLRINTHTLGELSWEAQAEKLVKMYRSLES